MQGKGKSIYTNQAQQDMKRRRQIRSWLILIGVVVAVFVALRLLQNIGTTREITISQLPCYSDQSVTPFGENVLYFDGASIHCLSGIGAIRWSYPVGADASFTVSDKHLVIWQGTQLYIVDENGRPTYNESMSSAIQFARVGKNYVAVIIGGDTEPELLVKDLTGAQVDEEADAFSGMMILDCGFYGDDGQNLWTLSMDVYGTKANTVMNTFQVGKMNTGEVSLGDAITYKVLFENGRLRVFNTRQLYTYDYKGVQDTNATMLVYGWKLIDAYISAKGDAKLLMAPTAQTNTGTEISELRVDGGASRSRFLMQYQADLLHCAVRQPKCLETTALGSAMLAGLAVGVWESLDELRTVWKLKNAYDPQTAAGSEAKALKRWHKAVERSMGWADGLD